MLLKWKESSKTAYVAVVITMLLLLLHLGCVGAYGATCETNLDCCRHPPSSAAFKVCCSGGCCPDCDKVTYVSAMKSHAIKDGCEASYECCVYQLYSDKWLSCCSKHPCCTLCHKVSKGCCYSGKMYQFGSTVASLPKVNTNLVCGAKLSKTPPYFTATVVPVLHSLPHDQKCAEPTNNYCVEENGVIHVNGSKWLRNTCLLCRCDSGVVTCRPVRPACPPPPYPECVAMHPPPGDCCHAWNCSMLESMCVDAYGKVRQVGEQWAGRDDPCLLYICKAGGMVRSARRGCPPPPTVPPGCELLTRPQQCCSVLHCPARCPDPFAFNRTCIHYYDQCSKDRECRQGEKCCKVASCGKTCMIAEQDYCERAVCPDPLSFNRKCFIYLDQCHQDTECHQGNKCCLVAGCGKECMRVQQSYCERAVCPDPFSFNKRCIRYLDQCHQDTECRQGEKCCLVAGCGKECMTVPKPGSGCVDRNGEVHPLGSTWTDAKDPCTTYECSDRGVRLVSRSVCLPLGPQPDPACRRTKKHCCYVWDCGMNKTYCVDAQGKKRDIGEEWIDLVNPCIHYRCMEDLSVVNDTFVCALGLPPKPRPNCILVVEQCCPFWKCPCVDAAGVERGVGDVWKHPTNECISLECTTDGVQERVMSCPLLPSRPDPRCKVHVDGCCSAWKCPAVCPDPFSFNRQCSHYSDQCYQDKQCRQGEKCCLVAGCGKECMTVPKPGKCPVIRTIAIPQCDAHIKDACGTDQDCRGLDKCCFLLCNKQCVQPL